MSTAASTARRTLLALLEGITPAAGYRCDLTGRVFDGRAVRMLTPDTPRPLVIVRTLGDTEGASAGSSYWCERRFELQALVDVADGWEDLQDDLLADIRRAIAQPGVKSTDRLSVQRDGEAQMPTPEPGSLVAVLSIPIKLKYLERTD